MYKLSDNEIAELERECQQELNSHYLVATILLEVMEEIKHRSSLYL